MCKLDAETQETACLEQCLDIITEEAIRETREALKEAEEVFTKW